MGREGHQPCGSRRPTLENRSADKGRRTRRGGRRKATGVLEDRVHDGVGGGWVRSDRICVRAARTSTPIDREQSPARSTRHLEGA